MQLGKHTRIATGRENISSQAKIIFRYQAQKVFLVASSEKEVFLTLSLDGKTLGYAAGSDLGAHSKVLIKADQLYRLVEDPEGYGEHTLEIIIEGAGLKAFTFTFG